MRTKKTWLTSAAMAVGGLLAATAAMASGSGSGSQTCSPFPGSGIVAAEPCTVAEADLGSPVCKSASTCEGSACGDDYTGIRYTITPDVKSVLTLVTVNNTVVSEATGNDPEEIPCKGDTSTGLGKLSCHEKLVRIPNEDSQDFWVVVKGIVQPVPTTVVAKKKTHPYTTYCAPVLGLGLDGPVAPVTETLEHGECAVEFTMNAFTGTVLSAKLTQASVDAACDFLTNDVQDLAITLHGDPIGTVNYGNGHFNTGGESCTTRVIGGRVYTWGKPCP